MHVRGLMMVGLTLLDARTTISAMPWVMLDFMVNLNKPCWEFRPQPKRMAGTIRANFPSLGCPHGHGLQLNFFNTSRCRGNVTSTFACS
jgi:hypothetical protein